MNLPSQAVLEYVDWDNAVPDYSNKQVLLTGLHNGLERIMDTNLTTKIHARQFPKEVHVQEYHNMLLKLTHNNILRPRNLYRNEAFDVITFDPLETTIGSYYKKNSDILTTGPKSNHVTDYSPLMIQMICDIASALECIHKNKMYHGKLDPENVYLILNHEYSKLDVSYATVKLALRTHEYFSFTIGNENLEAILGKEQKEDWSRLGKLIGRLQNSKSGGKEFKEIENLISDLTKGRITSKRQLLEHPATWNAAQRSFFLNGAIQLLQPWEYHSISYPSDESYSVTFGSLIQLMPNDASDATKPESHCRFDKLTRNVATHLDDPTKPKLKLVVGVNRGVALRYLRYFHPLLFTDLISNARYYAPQSTEELLNDAIKYVIKA